jgi:hypothetical protein
VPTVAWWPGKIAPGSVCDAVAGTIDLLPTAVSLAGGTVPAQPVIDGRDISPLLFGKSTQSPREAHYYFSSYNLQAVRQGPWKLALTAQPEIKGKAVAADVSGKGPRLYNLDAEIGEQTNLAEKHPDIVARLQGLAEKMSAEIGGTAPSARRPAGEVANPVALYPSEDRAPREKVKRKSGKAAAANLDAMQPGETLDSSSAPQIGGKGFTLSCTVDTKQRDTILLAHGGLSAGYALHVKGGRVAFLVRMGGSGSFTEIVSATEFRGSGHISATLGADAMMTLKIDDQPVATGKAAGLIARQPLEDFCLGHDNAKPLTTYASQEPFQGTITQLKVTTP